MNSVPSGMKLPSVRMQQALVITFLVELLCKDRHLANHSGPSTVVMLHLLPLPDIEIPRMPPCSRVAVCDNWEGRHTIRRLSDGGWSGVCNGSQASDDGVLQPQGGAETWINTRTTPSAAFL